jgi:hypothetical protein
MENKPNDLPLIVAHLLGGTNGFNFFADYSREEIKIIVERAVAVAVEILNQTEAISAQRPALRSLGEVGK